MELIQYLQLLRRWWWLLVITASIAGGLSYVVGRSQDPVYEAEVKLFVGNYLQNPNPGATEIRTGTDLALTYARLATVRPILEATIANAGVDISPEDLSEEIVTTPDTDTSILSITVKYSSPVQAANIANELANQLILNSPTNLSPEEQDRRQIIEEQLTSLGTQIAEAQTEIAQIDESIGNTSSADTISTLQARRDVLISQISQWQQSLADLSTSLEGFSQRSNTLQVVEPALIPTDPVDNFLIFRTLGAALVGIVFAFAIVLLIEYLDDSIRGPEDVREVLHVPVLAGVVKFGNRRDTYQDKVVTLKAPNSSPVEGYRTLRTNLLYGAADKDYKRIIVTSARVSEGKSITAANLAVSLAKSEVNTVLIDTDLHRPQVHNAFGLDNRVGLSDLFEMDVKPPDLIPAKQLNNLLQATSVPSLRVITSGPLPANPAELLGLYHMQSLCKSLEETMGVDMIVFDSPPVLSVIDSTTLASNTGASVVLVVLANRTRRDQASSVLEQFKQVGVDVVGVVLNNITSQSNGYYYYYGYGRYGESEQTSKP